MTITHWNEEQDNVLRHLYLFHRMGRKAIAAEMGFEDVMVVARRIARLRLVDRLPPAEFRRRQLETSDKLRATSLEVRAAKHGQFVWSEHQLATARRMYVDELKLAPEIARELNCRPKDVWRKAHMMGWPALRPPGFRKAQLIETARANCEKGAATNKARALTNPGKKRLAREASKARMAAKRQMPPRPSIRPEGKPRPYVAPPERAVSASDAELIARAIAAGKITIVPAAIAPGITALEREWGTTPPESKKMHPWRTSVGGYDRKKLIAEAAKRAASYAAE